MIRPVLVLLALVLSLALGEGWLARRAARARAADTRVGTLFTPAEREELRQQPALRVEGAGAVHRYGRVKGEWRCLSLHDAPADGRALQAWLDALAGAEGIVHARTVEEAPAYGINTPATWRVSIQGPRAAQDPGGDVRATLEVGFAQPERDACFVRRKGTKEIWSISGDLRAPLEETLAPDLPPLLAPAAVPASAFEGGGVARITVEDRAAARAPFTLARHERALDPATLEPGMRPWTWKLETADASELQGLAADAFAGFLERLPYAGVLDPAQRNARGIATPRAVVTLEPRAGPPLALVFGSADERGRVALWVEASGTLYEVDSDVFALVVPTLAELMAVYQQDDPWSAALGARGGGR